MGGFGGRREGRNIAIKIQSQKEKIKEKEKDKEQIIDRSSIIRLGVHRIQQTLTGEVETVSWSPPFSFLSMAELPLSQLPALPILGSFVSWGTQWCLLLYFSAVHFPSSCLQGYNALILRLFVVPFPPCHRVWEAVLP